MHNKVRRYKQLSLCDSMFKEAPKTFGGSLSSNPKTKRPVSTKKPMHLTLRSKIANNGWVLCSNGKIEVKENGITTYANGFERRTAVENIIKKEAIRFNVKIYRLAVNSNHIHLLLKLHNRESFAKFIKSVSSLIARFILGIKRGKGLGLCFWEGRPFTRIVNWAKEFFTVKEYIYRNDLESLGVIPYSPRGRNKKKYKYRYEKSPLPTF